MTRAPGVDRQTLQAEADGTPAEHRAAALAPLGPWIGWRVDAWGPGTGFKMFVMLVLALLPLGILAVVGTIQTIRTTENERMSTVRLDASAGASRLLAQFNRDRFVLRLVANLLERDPHRTDICHRATTQFQAGGRPIPFAVFTRDGVPLCLARGIDFEDVRGGANFYDQQGTLQPREQGLIVRVNSVGAANKAAISYDARQLDAISGLGQARGSAFLDVTLRRGPLALRLMQRGRRPDAARVDAVTLPLNLGGIDITMATERPPLDLLRFTATLLPIILWLAAAGLGWWMVNIFLIRPLVDLNRHVAAYKPGTLLAPLPERSGLAQEINMLADTFREITQDVVEHDAQLSDALAQQRALTREVHHRVKNNLQIIASLINLHSRAAQTPEVAAAYASIQRRVDALSVVHRNHYAAAELSHGIDAQALISELAGALRASIPERNSPMVIRVEGDNVYLSQDVAVPTAFLITELVELVLLSGHAAPVRIALRRIEGGLNAELSITSDALRPSPEVDGMLEESFGRVLVGLTRQLRATLHHDADAGRYAIVVVVRG